VCNTGIIAQVSEHQAMPYAVTEKISNIKKQTFARLTSFHIPLNIDYIKAKFQKINKHNPLGRLRLKFDPLVLSVVAVSGLAYITYSGDVERFILWYKLASNAENALLADPINITVKSLNKLASQHKAATKVVEAEFDGVTTYLADDTRFKITMRFTDYPECYLSINGAMESTAGIIKNDSTAELDCLFYDRQSSFGKIELSSIAIMAKDNDPSENNKVNKYLIDSSSLSMGKLMGWSQLTPAEKIKWGRD
jgi:hypothetical protein